MERSYDLVCFDLDGTLIQGTIFIWQTLHDAFRTDRKLRQQAKEDFHAGRISYQAWFDHDLVLLREAKATRTGMIDALQGVHATPGASEVLDTLRGQGVKLAILSGSLDLVLTHFYDGALFDEVLINRIRFDENDLLEGGTHTPYDVDHKGDGLLEIGRRTGVDVSRIAFVGDNYNDVSAARAARLAIAFNPNSQDLVDVADVVVRSPDLRAILPHLLPMGAY